MSDGYLVLLFVLIGIALAIASAGLSAWLATQRGRNEVAWFFLGFFFGPTAVLAVGLAPPRRDGTQVSLSGPLSLAFGKAGEDDWAIEPLAACTAEESGGYVLLLEHEADDPKEAFVGWPIIPGDRIVWASVEDESYPVAVVSARLVGDERIFSSIRPLLTEE